ncbi:hypothetical protein [Raineyella sp. LH-20]|uniref:hypothetical protein n=1 Tax=Raineyella sp. LH-20 TaxID=3081204 RepID=UPI002955BC06|nr:hypothetical protein [Raineyella sp. LH-20]WOP19148.1 hypothetical protein R0146_02425 [Raineyella sp. LH-20]
MVEHVVVRGSEVDPPAGRQGTGQEDLVVDPHGGLRRRHDEGLVAAADPSPTSRWIASARRRSTGRGQVCGVRSGVVSSSPAATSAHQTSSCPGSSRRKADSSGVVITERNSSATIVIHSRWASEKAGGNSPKPTVAAV